MFRGIRRAMRGERRSNNNSSPQNSTVTNSTSVSQKPSRQEKKLEQRNNKKKKKNPPQQVTKTISQPKPNTNFVSDESPNKIVHPNPENIGDLPATSSTSDCGEDSSQQSSQPQQSPSQHDPCFPQTSRDKNRPPQPQDEEPANNANTNNKLPQQSRRQVAATVSTAKDKTITNHNSGSSKGNHNDDQNENDDNTNNNNCDTQETSSSVTATATITTTTTTTHQQTEKEDAEDNNNPLSLPSFSPACPAVVASTCPVVESSSSSSLLSANHLGVVMNTPHRSCSSLSVAEYSNTSLQFSYPSQQMTTTTASVYSSSPPVRAATASPPPTTTTITDLDPAVGHPLSANVHKQLPPLTPTGSGSHNRRHSNSSSLHQPTRYFPPPPHPNSLAVETAVRRSSLSCSYTSSEDEGDGVTMDPSILSTASSLTADDCFTLASATVTPLSLAVDHDDPDDPYYESLLGLQPDSASSGSQSKSPDSQSLAQHPKQKHSKKSKNSKNKAFHYEQTEPETRGKARRRNSTLLSFRASSSSQVHRLKAKARLETFDKKEVTDFWDDLSVSQHSRSNGRHERSESLEIVGVASDMLVEWPTNKEEEPAVQADSSRTTTSDTKLQQMAPDHDDTRRHNDDKNNNNKAPHGLSSDVALKNEAPPTAGGHSIPLTIHVETTTKPVLVETNGLPLDQPPPRKGLSSMFRKFRKQPATAAAASSQSTVTTAAKGKQKKKKESKPRKTAGTQRETRGALMEQQKTTQSSSTREDERDMLLRGKRRRQRTQIAAPSVSATTPQVESGEKQDTILIKQEKESNDKDETSKSSLIVTTTAKDETLSVEKDRQERARQEQQLILSAQQDSPTSMDSGTSSQSSLTFRIVGVVEAPKHDQPKKRSVNPGRFRPQPQQSAIFSDEEPSTTSSSSSFLVQSPKKKMRQSKNTNSSAGTKYSTPAIEQARLKKEAASSRASQLQSQVKARSNSFYQTQQNVGDNVSWFVCVENNSYDNSLENGDDDFAKSNSFVLLPVRTKDDKHYTPPEDDGSIPQELILLHDEDDDDDDDERKEEPVEENTLLVPFVSFMPHVSSHYTAWRPTITTPSNTTVVHGLDCVDGTKLRAKLFNPQRLALLLSSIKESPQQQTQDSSLALVVHSSQNDLVMIEERAVVQVYRDPHQQKFVVLSSSDEEDEKQFQNPPILDRMARDASSLALILRDDEQNHGDDEVREPPATERPARMPPSTATTALATRSSSNQASSSLLSQTPTAVLYHPKPYRSNTVVGHAMEALQELEQRKLRVRLRKACPINAAATS
ncbi:hypothetical protein ACA910_018085 [Epithemia clementina (nom. ined.)]